jgi:NAD(P)H-nitrite reductase large subunit
VHLADGERFEADLIVAAIGVTPDTAPVEAAGLPCANGILVGSFLETPDPDIFAAGGCAC